MVRRSRSSSEPGSSQRAGLHREWLALPSDPRSELTRTAANGNFLEGNFIFVLKTVFLGSSRRCRAFQPWSLPAPPCAPAVRLATSHSHAQWPRPAWASLRMCLRQNDGTHPVLLYLPAQFPGPLHLRGDQPGSPQETEEFCRHARVPN